jgi:uncharacterized membrane protein
MSSQVHPGTFVSKSMHTGASLRSYADRALRWSAAFWFVVVVIGELIFAATTALFYGMTAARGNWQQWNKNMSHGYSPDHPMGNVVVAIHLASAVVIMLSGAAQLVPWVRRKAPRLHRWNGRVYMVTAFTVSLAGLYMMWFRGAVGDFAQHIGQSLDAVLIVVFAVLALRYALVRDFQAHRRWSLRLFMAVSAALFIRASVFVALATNNGPLLTFFSYGQYLVPLAVLELYLRTQQKAGAMGRFAMAAGLFVLTVALGAGIAVVSVTGFYPMVKRALDSRASIADVLAATIASDGMDRAERQYRELKAASPEKYVFDEDELNSLGYRLVQSHQVPQAIRVFQWNVDAFPKSANTWDSLGEGYMDNGDKPQAVAAYRRSLVLNPGNKNAVSMLRRLGDR